MKIQAVNFDRAPGAPGSVRAGERGMATFILIVLLAIMMVLIMGETTALFRLRQQTKLLEQRQIERLDASQTHSAAVVEAQSK